MRTEPLLVVQTFFCAPHRGRREHYEIHLASDPPRPLMRVPVHRCDQRCLVLTTDDQALYDDAVDAEGTPQRVVATWHADHRQQILDRLEVAP